MKPVIVSLSCLLLACNAPHTPFVKNVVDDSVKNAAAVIYTDSLQKAARDTNVYSSYMIPVYEKDSSCLMIVDSADSLAGVDTSPDENRWHYYAAIRKRIPQDVLKVHKMVWALPEVQAAASNNGKMGDATEILYRLGNDADCYCVRLAKDYGWRLGRNMNVPFFYVYPKQNMILAYSVIDDTAVSIEEWRRLVKEGNDHF